MSKRIPDETLREWREHPETATGQDLWDALDKALERGKIAAKAQVRVQALEHALVHLDEHADLGQYGCAVCEDISRLVRRLREEWEDQKRAALGREEG